MSITETVGNYSLILSWYLILIIIVLLTPAFSNESGSDYEAPSGICDIKCILNFTESGSIQFNQECKPFCINLDFNTKGSIINLTASINQQSQRSRNEEPLTTEENVSEGSLKVSIFESTAYDDGSKEYILQEEWNEAMSQVPVQRNYLSWTSTVFIFVSSTGGWCDYDIKFSFHEIKPTLRPLSFSSDSGEIEVEYLPNSVSLYRLNEESNEEGKGIEITVTNLNINKEMGEYLLIGPGTEIFQSKYYLPLFVTEVMKNSTFYVANSSAYVAFVSGPIQRDKTFSISWNRVGAKALPDEEEDLSGYLNSAVICFSNYSAAAQEFEKDKLKKFRQNFSDFVKLHTENKDIKNIDEISVELFGQPVIIDEIESKALSILVKVVHKGKSIFTSRELQNVIEEYRENSTNLLLEYKVIRCPHQNEDLPYNDSWSFLIYAMVPVFGLLALMTWAWKQNVFTQKYTSEKDEKLCYAPSVYVQPNPYETSVPKAYLHDGQQRRATLIQGSAEEERTEDGESAFLSRFLTSRNTKRRPTIHSLLERTEETNELPVIPKSVNEESESEHLYDSVSKEMDETKL